MYEHDEEEEMLEKLLAREWLAPNEVAFLMEVAPSTARRWLKEGLLSGVKIGGSWRVYREHILDFAEKNQELYGAGGEG